MHKTGKMDEWKHEMRVNYKELTRWRGGHIVRGEIFINNTNIRKGALQIENGGMEVDGEGKIDESMYKIRDN